MEGILITVIIIIVLLITIGLINYAAEYAFNKAFNKHKKTEQEAYEYLKIKNLYDKEIYDEIEREEVFITSRDNLILKGYLVEEYKDSNRYVILVHGYTGNNHIHMAFLRFFIKEGFNVLLVDERAHGESQGNYPSYGYFEREDLDEWIEFLSQRVHGNLFLGLHGQSMGGATVLMCGARNERVDFIIEDCGYSSGKEIIKYQFTQVNWVPFNTVYLFLKLKVNRRIKFKFNKVSPIDDIMGIKTPIMFIHGKSDTCVPSEMAVDMYKIRNNENDRIFLVEGADHMWAYSKKKREYESIMREFIVNAEKLKEYGEMKGLHLKNNMI